MTRIGNALAVAMLAAAVRRQPSAAQAPIFSTETRLVVLHATVKNARGEFVADLPEQAFTVYEDGRRQPITLFRRDDVPVSLGLLIDNSGSMRRLRPKVEAAALAFARASNPDDEVFVLNFADRPHVDVPLTGDVHVLEAGIARVDAIGGTALHDAVGTALQYVQQHATRARRILLVVTDGNDNASLATAAQVERQAESTDTVIDAIGLFIDGDTSKTRAGHHELDRLTERTGGVVYYPASVDQVESLAVDLAKQIRRQYTIAYAPLNQRRDGSYRTIRLAVSGPRLSVRTRPGYRADASSAR